MAEFTPYRIDFEEALVLADLEGVRQDLEWVIQLGNKYIELNKMPYETLILEALFFALIIRYGRVHGSGVRGSIPSAWIKELSQKQQEDHKYFMDLRNKHVAHSVNNFEENWAVVFVKHSKSKMPEFNQIQVQHSRITGVSSRDVEVLMALSAVLLENVKEQIKSQRKIVAEIVQGLPINSFILDRSAPALTSQNVGKPRKRIV